MKLLSTLPPSLRDDDLIGVHAPPCQNNYLSRRGGGKGGDPVRAAEEPRGRGKHERGVIVRGQLGGVAFHVRWKERQTVTAATLLQMEQTRLN